jgi:hypothetical protein
MDPVERINPTYRLFIATASSAISAIAFDGLTHLLKSRALALTALLIVISLLVLVLSELLEEIIERSVAVRRFFAGDEFIEGYWYDITVDAPRRRVVHGVLCRISYKEGSFVLEGVTYNLQGNRVATFNSESAAFANRRLSFEYRGPNEEFSGVIQTGFTQLQFDSPPQSYSGFYFDYDAAVHASVQGYKVDLATLKKFGFFATADSKRAFLVPLLTARQAELDALEAATPASAAHV